MAFSNGVSNINVCSSIDEEVNYTRSFSRLNTVTQIVLWNLTIFPISHMEFCVHAQQELANFRALCSGFALKASGVLTALASSRIVA